MTLLVPRGRKWVRVTWGYVWQLWAEQIVIFEISSTRQSLGIINGLWMYFSFQAVGS
jgi:hypothetical protein